MGGHLFYNLSFYDLVAEEFSIHFKECEDSLFYIYDSNQYCTCHRNSYY